MYLGTIYLSTELRKRLKVAQDILLVIYASVMAVYDSLNNTTEWDWLQGWRVPSAV
jgi:hypothetical protein